MSVKRFRSPECKSPDCDCYQCFQCSLQRWSSTNCSVSVVTWSDHLAPLTLCWPCHSVKLSFEGMLTWNSLFTFLNLYITEPCEEQSRMVGSNAHLPPVSHQTLLILDCKPKVISLVAKSRGISLNRVRLRQTFYYINSKIIWYFVPPFAQYLIDRLTVWRGNLTVLRVHPIFWIDRPTEWRYDGL